MMYLNGARMNGLKKVFDYVIVGAGSAGCVVANRLSRDRSVSVCLLEAGPSDDTCLIQMPKGLAFTLYTYGNLRLTLSRYNWGFWTEPGEGSGHQVYVPRMRAVGGCSGINGCIYARGHRDDYNDWEQRLNCRGWGWQECLKSFKEMESNEVFCKEEAERVNQMQHVDPGVHGSQGELFVENLPRNPAMCELDEIFMKAASDKLNLPVSYDYNAGDQTGVTYFQRTVHHGVRQNSSLAFLGQLGNTRPNLTVLTGAHATSVTFSGKEATGVTYVPVSESGVPQGDAVQVMARERVVLCLGAIQTPQLLQLSGVGDSAELQRAGVGKVVHHLPGVGKNLMDHADVTLAQALNTSSGVRDNTVLPQRVPMLYREWQKWHNGSSSRLESFWSQLPIESGYFARTPYSKQNDPLYDRPDIQAHFVNSDSPEHPLTPPTRTGYRLKTTVLYPKSTGSLQLRNSDPFASPIIKMNLLKSEQDMAVMCEGVRMAAEVLSHSAFDKTRKGCIGVDVSDMDKLRKYCKDTVATTYHPAGTCKMGHDDMAVVDDRGSVHGLTGLSVVDTSIFPALIGGNTNAPTMMAANRVAQFIQEGKC